MAVDGLPCMTERRRGVTMSKALRNDRVAFLAGCARRLFLAATAIPPLLAGVPATAADIAVKAPNYKAPPPLIVYNWTGFYIGGSVGWAHQRDSGTSNWFAPGSSPRQVNNPQSDSLSADWVIGGVQLGYNWQVAPSWVLGVEGDWQWSRPKYSFCRQTDVFSIPCADNGIGFLTIGGETKWLATIRGRVGLTFDRIMVYGTGGVAWADVHTAIAASCLVNGCGNQILQLATAASFSETKAGWVAGVGIEGMLSANWTARAEWLHVEVGTITDALNILGAGGPQSATWSRTVRYDVLRFGVNYRFGGSVVASY
jgi:outer membrane immunogenic protein